MNDFFNLDVLNGNVIRKTYDHNLIDTVKHIEEHTFDGVHYDNPDDIKIEGKQFTIIRISNYGKMFGGTKIIKTIEDNGGVYKTDSVKSSDYVIVTAKPISKDNAVYVKEQEKYDKAVSYNLSQGKPKIIRDIDFYIVFNMFSSLPIEEKRRIVLEYIKGNNPNFNDKNTKSIITFIKNKGRSDLYLKEFPEIKAIADGAAKTKAEKKESSDAEIITLREWRKHFSLTEDTRNGKKGYVVKKCKTLTEVVRIPEMIEGKPVVALERKTFMETEGFVKEVIIPKSVVYIGDCAFCDCPALERVVIDNSKCMIYNYAFYKCPNLKEIIINGKPAEIEKPRAYFENDYVILKQKR